MTQYKTEIVFELTSPIQYHAKGQIEESYQIILKAPCNRVGRQCNQLKQGYKRAFKSLVKDFAALNNGNISDADKENAKEEDSMTGEQIIEFLQMSEIDYSDYVDTFKSLVTNKIAFVNNDVSLNSVMFDSLSLQDTDKMLGEYLESFLLI